MKVLQEFYQGENVVSIARGLLGKIIYTKLGDGITAGIITETEAYAGSDDRASHAYGNKRTKRTETMFQSGGIAYIYLCYGVHHLFNFVTNVEGIPHAVLLRGIQAVEGIDIMMKRTGKKSVTTKFTDGPGKLTKALGIETFHDGTDLCGNKIWVEDAGIEIVPSNIISGPRIGVDYAGADAGLPYRFLIKNL